MRKFWENHKETIKLYLYALLFSFLATTLAATSLSFLYPATNVDEINQDSSFFLYQGYLFSIGQTPYIDFYDHKGIYHLLINALGVLMGGRYALFLLNCLFSSFSLFFLFLSMREIGKGSFLDLLVAAAIYNIFLSCVPGGNTESCYILPFIAAAFHFALKGVKNGDDKSLYIGAVLMGIQVGLALNSRVSDAAWGGGLALFYLIWLLKEKRYRTLLISGLLAFASCLLVSSIFIFIALGGGYLKEMLKAIFVDGFTYLGSKKEGEYIVMQWTNRIGLLLVAITAIFIYLYERRKAKEAEPEKRNHLPEFFAFNTFFACFIYFIIARFVNYYYGAICFVILYIFYFCSFFSFRKISKKIFSSCFYVFTLGALLTIFLTMYYGHGSWGFSYAENLKIKEDISLIPEEERKEKGNFFALDLYTGVYIVAEATTDFPYYTNQTWWTGKVIDAVSLTNAYLEKEGRPTYLLVSNEEATWNNFGETISKYYEPYMPEQIQNSIFKIYRTIS